MHVNKKKTRIRIPDVTACGCFIRDFSVIVYIMQATAFSVRVYYEYYILFDWVVDLAIACIGKKYEKTIQFGVFIADNMAY